MDDNLKFMAQYVLNQLNSMGVVKDAQVNTTSVLFVANAMQTYMEGQKLELRKREKE